MVMNLNYHCADCGHTWQGLGGQCPRCGSRRVRNMRRGSGRGALIGITVLIAAAILITLGMNVFSELLTGGSSESGIVVEALEVEHVYDELYAVTVTVRNDGDGAFSVSLDNMEFYDESYSVLFPAAVWPDGSERKSAYLPARRTLLLTGVVELAPGTEQVGVVYYNGRESGEIWADVE